MVVSLTLSSQFPTGSSGRTEVETTGDRVGAVDDQDALHALSCSECSTTLCCPRLMEHVTYTGHICTVCRVQTLHAGIGIPM